MEITIPTIPGYKILGELGRGGMGIVYKAEDLRNDRLVAVKLILSGRGANLTELARFRIEAEAIGYLEHPNIVQSHDIGVHSGIPSSSLNMPRAAALPRRFGHFQFSATGPLRLLQSSHLPCGMPMKEGSFTETSSRQTYS